MPNRQNRFRFHSKAFGRFEEIEKLLQTISIEEIIEKTETSLEVIEYLADLYADDPASTFMGLGMQRYKNGAGRYGGLTL